MPHNRVHAAAVPGMPVSGGTVGVADHVDHLVPCEERATSQLRWHDERRSLIANKKHRIAYRARSSAFAWIPWKAS